MQLLQQFDEAPCFYFCTSDNGILLQVNETLCLKLGFSKNELIGKKTEIIFPVATRIFQQTHLFPLLKMQQYAHEIFISLQTKNKEQIPVLLNAERKIIDDEPVNVYIGIEVNNRKKFEDELIAAKKTAELALSENTALNTAKEQLQQRIEQLDEQMQLVKKQNKELQQFNHAISHDLQEPLRKLSVFSDMILQTNNKDQHEQNIKKLKRVLEQMRSVMSGLQQYIWLTGNLNKAGNIDLNAVIKQAKQQSESGFPGVNLSIQQQQLPFIYADEKQMVLLFCHIFSNAIRFRKPGTNALVKITADSIKLNRFQNIRDKYQYTNFLKIAIIDEGIGFDAAYKEQAFELFKRLHTSSGRGLGLALCKKIIDNHYGMISIDSIEHKGTTVTLLLPERAE
ncbi:MAG: ATP-binding protein [Parafilimonas sp.]